MMQTMPRLLKIKLPKSQSAFLWGPRKTGKTTFLRATFPDSLNHDLLQTDLFLEFVKRPFLLREQLLDEIHWLMENKVPGKRIL